MTTEEAVTQAQENQVVYRLQAAVLDAVKRCQGCGRTKFVYQFTEFGAERCRRCASSTQ